MISGELLVGPARVLFMDEISNGLDSSTTYQIIKYLKHSTRALDGTTVISLLQPSPETYELFDDVILLCEGQIVYQGPRDSVLDFFTSMGFSCPKRKNVADFLQEVSLEELEIWVHSLLYGNFAKILKHRLRQRRTKSSIGPTLSNLTVIYPQESLLKLFVHTKMGRLCLRSWPFLLIDAIIIQQPCQLLNMERRRVNFSKPALTGSYC